MNILIKKRITAINNGIIPEGYKKTKVGIVPVEWEVVKLSDVSQYAKNIVVGENYVGTDNMQKDCMGTPLFSSNESVKGVMYEKGDILISNIRPYLKKAWKSDRVGVCSTDVLCLKVKNINSEYLFSYISQDCFFEYIMEGAKGSKMPRGDKQHIMNHIFTVPPLPEQQKIAEILSMQDNLIELQERKINQLKTLKKGYLQKMFPKKSSKYPELRFKGFTDAWEQRKLSKLTTAAPFKNYLKEANDDGKYEVIQQGDNPVLGYADGNPFIDFDKVTLFGDHTLSLYKPKAPFFVATDGLKILYSEGMNGLFYYYLLERYKPESEGYKRHFSILKECECLYTLNIKEQSKIGKFFDSLDNLVTLHQRKLDEEKQKKKALMQLLLTGKVRVKL